MIETIDSPLSSNNIAVLKKIIPVKRLIIEYKKLFDIDVTPYFHGIEEIGIFECKTTKYRFYYPFNIEGDSHFYEQLQNFDWYYMPWKWENEETLKLLKGDEKILEIGSGGLGFIERMKEEGFDIAGLELNKESVHKANQRKLKVYNQSIQDFSKNNKEVFDVVCSYQVLEHVTQVRSFIQSQLDCLRKGGRMIVSVPNNETFIKEKGGGTLNFPPHHMGLWDTVSLKNLAKEFNLKIDKILYEPLQDYHVEWYTNMKLKKIIKQNSLPGKIFYKLRLDKQYKNIIRLNRKNIKGHTIMAVYIK